MANGTFWAAKRYFIGEDGWTEGEWIAFCNWLASHQRNPGTNDEWIFAAMEWRNQ